MNKSNFSPSVHTESFEFQDRFICINVCMHIHRWTLQRHRDKQNMVSIYHPRFLTYHTQTPEYTHNDSAPVSLEPCQGAHDWEDD